jgi:hypothetical protein
MCTVLASSVKSLKLHVNVMGLPCCWKFRILSMILTLVVAFLNFKQL